jgi:hypothetical protein
VPTSWSDHDPEQQCGSARHDHAQLDGVECARRCGDFLPAADNYIAVDRALTTGVIELRAFTPGA